MSRMDFSQSQHFSEQSITKTLYHTDNQRTRQLELVSEDTE